MDNNKDLKFIIGLLIDKLGGEVTISHEEQLKFFEGLANKELLMKDDYKNGVTFKLVNKKDIENPLEYMNKVEIKEK